ncbi:MAG TPA: biopolymer transporter ExbD [Bacteroidales bacterium]|jgi:biopolymer transport protein ExbD|nr:biopolymer transporter ExbD [Bacteroidales bacterium]
MSISSRNKVSVQFSMSGMTDIVFLLLIFFMLTSTLIAPNAIKLLLPRSSNQTQASPQVTVSITKEIDFYVGSDKIDFSQLEGRLEQELKFRVEPTLSLHADKSVPVEYVVKVMNIAKRHKYKVILATAPE